MKIIHLNILILLILLVCTPASGVLPNDEELVFVSDDPVKNDTLYGIEYSDGGEDLNHPEERDISSLRNEENNPYDSDTEQTRLGSYTIAYVGANTAVITWVHWSGMTRYEVYRNGFKVGSVNPSSGLKYIDSNLGRSISFTYRIDAYNDNIVDEPYRGYYDGDPVIPGQVLGDLSTFGETDTWSGGAVSMNLERGDVYLNGGTLILNDVSVIGSGSLGMGIPQNSGTRYIPIQYPAPMR